MLNYQSLSRLLKQNSNNWHFRYNLGILQRDADKILLCKTKNDGLQFCYNSYYLLTKKFHFKRLLAMPH